MTRTIDVVDTTTRDGNQSIWSATGLTTPDIVAIAPTLDRVGYHACDFTSGTHMAVSVRFHHGGKAHEERATLVLEKRGITRMDKGTARDSFSHDAFEEAAEEA